MDAVSTLLRAAIRIADASAAIVAFDDEHTPLAFAGCSQSAAAAALRDGRGDYIDCVTVPRPATLVLIGAKLEANARALSALAREVGEAVLDATASFDDGLDALAKSIETLADPVAVFFPPPDAGEEPATFARVNGSFERLFGWSNRELAGQDEETIFAPAINRESVLHVRERLAAGEPVRSILEMRTREDVPVWIELTARVVVDDTARPHFYVSTLRDITARKEFEAAVAAEKQRLSVTLKAIGDAVITTQPDGRVDFINLAAQRLLHVEFADAYGMPLRTIIDLRDAHDAPCDITFDPETDVRGQGVLHGIEHHVHISFVSSPIAVHMGAPFGYVIVLRDITAQHRLTRRLAYEANHDPLTRLPNRRRFEEMVGSALESARHIGAVHAIAYIDLDRFKAVNDTFGHQVGDQFLRDVASRMSLNVRGNDILARLGGDEFALLLHECSLDGARRVGEKIRQTVEQNPVEREGVVVHVGASIGLAQLDRNCENAADVIASADRACYAAKAAGRNAVVVAPR